MTYEYSFFRLKAELIEIGIEEYILECWGFGSGLLGDEKNTDLDVLLVYETETKLKIAKELIGKLSDCYQLDLICMLQSEVHETRFLKDQKCVQLIPNNSSYL